MGFGSRGVVVPLSDYLFRELDETGVEDVLILRPKCEIPDEGNKVGVSIPPRPYPDLHLSLWTEQDGVKSTHRK